MERTVSICCLVRQITQVVTVFIQNEVLVGNFVGEEQAEVVEYCPLAIVWSCVILTTHHDTEADCLSVGIVNTLHVHEHVVDILS